MLCQAENESLVCHWNFRLGTVGLYYVLSICLMYWYWIKSKEEKIQESSFSGHHLIYQGYGSQNSV